MTGPDPFGPRGKEKLSKLMQEAPATPGTPEFDDWLLSLQGDPTDPEFMEALSAAKALAQVRIKDRSGQTFTVGQKRTKASAEAEAQGKPSTYANDRNAKRMDEFDVKQYRELTAGRPIVKGAPVGASQPLNQANDPSGKRDPFLDQFANNEELQLDQDDRKIAVKSGDYVYVGQEEDPNGGKGFKRDVYVFADDAAASLARIPPDQIKQYQAKMGNPQTGMLDPQLIQAWNTAVKIGQSYARAGMKVDLRFIFDTLVNTKMTGAGGGGGGGGRFNGMSPSDIAANYYTAMMQVLGDISGVNG